MNAQPNMTLAEQAAWQEMAKSGELRRAIAHATVCPHGPLQWECDCFARELAKRAEVRSA